MESLRDVNWHVNCSGVITQEPDVILKATSPPIQGPWSQTNCKSSFRDGSQESCELLQEQNGGHDNLVGGQCRSHVGEVVRLERCTLPTTSSDLPVPGQTWRSDGASTSVSSNGRTTYEARTSVVYQGSHVLPIIPIQDEIWMLEHL